MPSNYRVGITCADPTILQILTGLLQEPECKITVEKGEYFWSSSLFETLSDGSEVAKKAEQYLPAFNGLVRLRLADAPKIVRSNKVYFTRESGETGAFLDITISIPTNVSLSYSEEEYARKRQRWIDLVRTWATQELNSSDALTNALTHFGEEVSWNSLYNTYEVIREDCKSLQNVTNVQNDQFSFEKWMVVNGRNREKDFTESANNAYISGIVAARHSLAKSHRIKEIEGSSSVEVIDNRGKKKDILPMSLREAKDFIARLLSQWLASKQDSQVSEHE